MTKYMLMGIVAMGLTASALAANTQVRVTVTGRDVDDELPLHVYVDQLNGPRDSWVLKAGLGGEGEVLLDTGEEIDAAQVVLGCIPSRAWLVPEESDLTTQMLFMTKLYARYAGTEAVAVHDLRDDLWTIEVVLTPACDLRLRSLDADGEFRTGFAWTGYGEAEPQRFRRFRSGLRDLDGAEMQLGQVRLLGIPRGEDLRIWLHDASIGAVGLNALRFEPMDVPGDDVAAAVAEVDLTWTPTPKGDTGRVQFTGLFEYPGADEEFLRFVMSPGSGYGEFLCVSPDRQQLVWVRPPDAVLFAAPYAPDVKFQMPGNGADSIVSINCLEFTYSADLPVGTWDVLPGGFYANDGPTLRRFLADPAGLPGPFPGISRITVQADQTISVELGAIGSMGLTALLNTVWCGPQGGFSVVAPAGVGWMPIQDDGN